MVDLGNTPFGKSLGDIKQAGFSSSSNFNAFLGQSLDAIVGVNVFRPDVNNLLQLVQANPLAYGFDNVTDACFDTSSSTPKSVKILIAIYFGMAFIPPNMATILLPESFTLLLFQNRQLLP